MRFSVPAILLACSVLVPSGAFAQASASRQADDDSIYWLDNYQDALKQAKATGKPIFLEYRCEP